jgi:hypothetical protein
LGERLLCKQEVVGSIPSGSTSFGPGETGHALQKMRNRFCCSCVHPQSGREGREAFRIHLHREEGIYLKPFRMVLQPGTSQRSSWWRKG